MSKAKKAKAAAAAKSASEVMQESLTPKPGDSAVAVAAAATAAAKMHDDCPPPVWKGTRWICNNHPRPVTVHVPREPGNSAIRPVGARVPTTPVAMGRGHMPGMRATTASTIGVQFTKLRAEHDALVVAYTKLQGSSDGDAEKVIKALEAQSTGLQEQLTKSDEEFAKLEAEHGDLLSRNADLLGLGERRGGEIAKLEARILELLTLVEESQDLVELKDQLAALAGKEAPAADDDD